LETNLDCLLAGDVEIAGLTENFIFILSKGILYQFDKNGKLIRKVNKTGQGPGECYSRCAGIDKKNQLIYIMDNWSLSIFIFDFEGNYIRNIKNPFIEPDIPTGMGCDTKGNIIYNFTNYYGQMQYKYVAMNNTGEILYKCLNYDKYELKERIKVFDLASYSVYEYKNNSYYPYSFNDTVFRINDDYTCSPAWIIHLPNKMSLGMELETFASLDYAALYGKNKFVTVREDKQYLYIYYFRQLYPEKSLSFLSLYDKRSKQLIEHINPLIQNDWDGGKDIQIASYLQKENLLYCLLQPFEMKEMLTDAHFSKVQAKYPEKQKALQTLVNNLKEDDNPVLMITELK
jgi:hypothetical protein